MNTLVTLSFILLAQAGTSTPARVAVVFDAQAPINAIEASVVVPEGAVPVISDTPSALSYWIEKPHYDPASRRIIFAGVVPGGSRGGELLEFQVPAQGDLSFSDARAYLDSPDATEAKLRLTELDLSPRPGDTLVLAVLLLVAALAVWFVVRHVRAKWV